MNNIVIKGANYVTQLSTKDYLYNEKNTLFINDDIDKKSADEFILDLYALRDKLKDKDNSKITIMINSLGGITIYGLAIIDAIEDVKKDIPIEVICYGYVASMATIIATCGTTRKAYSNTMLLIHEILVTGNQDKLNLTNIDNLNKEMKKHNNYLASLLAKNTNRSKDEVLRELKKNKAMTSQEALNFGLIDEII